MSESCTCEVCALRRYLRQADETINRLKDHNKRLRNAVGLLNSMVLSGEQHSDHSKDVVRNAVRES